MLPAMAKASAKGTGTKTKSKSKGGTAKAASAAKFWEWVKRHQAELRAAVNEEMTGEEPVFEALLDALHAHDPDLFFLLGGDPDETLDLVVTAEGTVDAFPAVIALVEAAPKLTGWSFLAFKPPMGFDFEMKHERATIDGRKAWFEPLATASGGLGVRLACAGYVADADDDFVYVAEMLLEAGLGELAARVIAGLDVVETPAAPETLGYLPLAQLPEWLEKHMVQA